MDATRFGTLPDGTAVDAFTLVNAGGVEVRVITYGAIIVSIRTPDRDGRIEDVTLGHDTLEGYLHASPYFGAVVGRYANRIARGRFVLDGREYVLAVNNGPNHLHGGIRGFDKHVWHTQAGSDSSGASLRLSRASPDGEEGYPGTLRASVTYTLSDRNELRVEYEAASDAATILNLTQHTYFNLRGDRAGTILDHELTLHAAAFTPVDATLIPTGVVAPVAGTPFDFRRPERIGARIDSAHPQLEFGRGYDHNWVLDRMNGKLAPAATVVEPESGRTLHVATTEPGLQFYSGNLLDGTISGKRGLVYARHAGFCLETQHFPDSPNHGNFPPAVLRPGETYRSVTVFTFGMAS